MLINIFKPNIKFHYKSIDKFLTSFSKKKKYNSCEALDNIFPLSSVHLVLEISTSAPV